MRIVNNERLWEIVLVENNDSDVLVAAEALKSVEEKSCLETFRDGETALSYIHKTQLQKTSVPDLIMLNLNCLGNSYQTIVKEINNIPELRKIPVIALDNSLAGEKVRDIYDLHVNCFMIKPEFPEELYKSMHTAFIFWLSIVRLSTCPHMMNNRYDSIIGEDQKYPDDPPFTRKGNILLVEDNPGDVRLTREALRDTGIECDLEVASNGVEALDYLNSIKSDVNMELPDLILLDLNLPRMDGREVLGIIKSSAELKHIPIFILTTSANEKDIEKAYDLHANCYIIKPLDMDQCIHIFHYLKLFWFYLSKLP